jgi:hypothetical protein
MGGFTSLQSDLLLAQAIVEVLDGKDDGPGIRHARALVALHNSGRIADPSALPSPPPAPQKEPRLTNVITNRDLDQPQGKQKRKRAWQLGA